MEGHQAPGKALNRFNTGHYADFAALHADVVEALNNELQAAHAELARVTPQLRDLADQVASLKKQSGELEQQLRAQRKPPKDGRK